MLEMTQLQQSISLTLHMLLLQRHTDFSFNAYVQLISQCVCVCMGGGRKRVINQSFEVVYAGSPSLHPVLSFHRPLPLFFPSLISLLPSRDPWPLVATSALTRRHLCALPLNHPLLNLSSWSDPQLLKALHFLSSNQLTSFSTPPSTHPSEVEDFEPL